MAQSAHTVCPMSTTLCGSLSVHPTRTGQAMHDAGYRALGLDFKYIPFKVTNLERALLGMRGLGIRGFGVSYPFKEVVIPLIDELTRDAESMRAVNTIVNTNGRLVGHNTDCIGGVRALSEVCDLQQSSVLLLGAGGAARAIAWGLMRKKTRVTITNRTLARAESLATETGATAIAIDALFDLQVFDAIVNATTLGMSGAEDGLPLDPNRIHPGQIVMDIVYKPLVTPWLQAAAQRGARTIHGGRMLLHQAAAQFELYTGQAAPIDAMESALNTQLASP